MDLPPRKEQTMKRYDVVIDGEVMKSFTSVATAIAYAHENGWYVYDTVLKKFVYDGYLDQLED